MPVLNLTFRQQTGHVTGCVVSCHTTINITYLSSTLHLCMLFISKI